MTFPETIWLHNQETEAIRLLHAAYQINSRFYINKGFFVLPFNIAKNPKVVYFPDLEYKKIKGFWKKSKMMTEELIHEDKTIVNDLIKITPEENVNILKIKKTWAKMESRFWKYIFELLPEYFKNIKTVEIRITNYGSIATAYSTWVNNSSKIIIYVRADADPSHIAEAILMDRIYKKYLKINYLSWIEIESIIDFLMTETPLAELFASYKATIPALKQKQQGELAKQSEKYLKLLGFKAEPIFAIKEEKIFCKNQSINHLLTTKEELILKLLLNKNREIVTFDEMAEKIWGTEWYDRFSPYAIAKLVQRLREKIESLETSPEIIQAIKKKGYILMN